MRPVASDDLLKPGEAVDAVNTSFSSGEIKPLQALASPSITLTSASPIQTIYRFRQDLNSESQFWFQSTNVAHFVKGPVDGDTDERTYFTGHIASYPAKTGASIATATPPYPTTSRPMGIAKPATAPVATVTGTATDPEAAAEGVTYVVTFVTDWNEEGPPSDAASVVQWRPGQSITLSLPTTGVASYPGNAHKPQPYSGKRIYRSAAGSGASAKFLLVAQVPVAETSYVDTASTANLNEALRSRYWLEPPDGMVGLTQMANGVLAGYVGNTVCFSEPFVPYAWPVRYQQSVDAPIVGMAAFNQSLLVATRRSLYVMTGVDPSSITSERLAVPQTCTSGRAMVEMNGGVVFPTPDGLGYVGPSGFQLLSEGLLDRKKWQAYAPASMHAYECDGDYICFYDTGSVQAGIVFKFGSSPTFYRTPIYATAGFRDRSQDALFLCVNAGGSAREIRKWDSGVASSFTWESGEFRMEAPINISVARVQHTGTVNFELIADGASRYGPIALTTQFGFKLPAGRYTRYKVRLTGTGTVRSVELATSMKELAGD